MLVIESIGFEQAPPCFVILGELCELLRSEYATIHDLEDLVKRDAALTASIVRLSNSAYAGGSTQTATLGEAVSRLGFTEVFKLVSLICKREAAHGLPEEAGIDPEALWQVSIATAVLMEYIAYDNNENPGEAYLIGLLSCIGKWPLSRQIVGKYNAMPPQIDADFVNEARQERELCDTDHAEVGATILERWAFPRCVSNPIRAQLHPLLAKEDVRQACMLHICRKSAPCLINPETAPFEQVEIPEAALEKAGVSRSQVESYLPSSGAWLWSTYGLVSKQIAIA